jgi:predicted RNase H-like nuclease
MHVIGIDWAASDETKCGLALGKIDGESVSILELMTGREAPDKRSLSVLTAWLRRDPDALVAIDAPLGWPSNLARAIHDHVAGEPLGKIADAPTFFTRETDRFVHREFGKFPLEVGADRIARTAFSALCLVSELRSATSLALRMAWNPGDSGILEVYPAATLKVIAAGARLAPYKKAAQSDARRAIVQKLEKVVTLTRSQQDRAVASDHLLDAVVCVLAGADFIAGRGMAPPEELLDRARREGWIWVRRS